jgi:uncharacterized protein
MEQIKRDTAALLSGEKTGHAYDHVARVYDLAMKLCRREEADEEIVALAALLHDCDDYKLFGQECADNLTNAKTIMGNAGIDGKTQAVVCDIIRSIGYSELLGGVRPQTIEGKIVSDADMLDAIGAMGILRCHAYALGKFKNPIFDRNVWPELDPTAKEYKRLSRESGNFINHFFEKLLKLKDLMLTEAGREEARSRHDVMVVFLRHFFEEQNAADWGKFLEGF